MTRAGLAAALGVVLAVLLAVRLGLDDPWWAAISAWIVSGPDRRAVLAKGGQRIAGTLLGAGGGYLVAGLAAGQPWLQAILLFALGAFGTRQRFGARRFAIAWFYAAVTALLVLMQSLGAPGDLDAFARARCLEILCGVLVATLCELALVAPAAAPRSPAPAAPPADAGRLALIGGLVLLLVPLAWALLDLPAATQMAVSAFILIDRDLGTQQARARQRLLGCGMGGLLGLLVMGLGADALLPWAVGLGGGLLLFARLHHGGGPQAYIGTQGGVALIMTMVSGTGPPDSLVPALQRLAGIGCGTLLLLLVSRSLLPRPASARRRGEARSGQPVA
jgi:uncharacterized membrane protein YccC